ncbi:MAG: hypothetical protein H7256_12345 [Bdellovibrio sp.]|nr:hypothetical protein [Bdellovibrio sp.]
MISKKFFLNVSLVFGLLLPSCGPVENSSTLDKTLYGNTFDTSGASPLFTAVRTSLVKCQSCHGSWLSLAEADFKTLGLVVAKSPESSKLYYRNSGATSGPGPKTMPNGGYPSLTNDELQGMVNWINSL